MIVTKENLQNLFNKEIKSFNKEAGNKHLNFSVELINRNKYFLRIVNPEKRINIGKNYFEIPLDVNREEFVTNKISELTNKSPKILRKTKIKNTSCLITSNISGVVFKKLWSENKDVDILINVVTSLGRIIGEVHKKEFNVCGDIFNKDFQAENWKNFIINSIKIKLNHPVCKKIKDFESKNFFLDSFSNFEIKNSFKLVIYDLHEGNFLVDKKGNVQGIFDFDHSILAPASLELVPLEFNLFGLLGEDNRDLLRKKFNEGYNSSKGNDLIKDLFWCLNVLNHYLGAIISYFENPDRKHFVDEFKKRCIDIVGGKKPNLIRFY